VTSEPVVTLTAYGSMTPEVLIAVAVRTRARRSAQHVAPEKECTPGTAMRCTPESLLITGRGRVEVVVVWDAMDTVRIG
jgi:hypothetical protein